MPPQTELERSATLPASFRSMTFGNAIRAAMPREPHKPALIHRDRTLSYAELVDRIDRLRDAAITELGVGRGDVVAIVSANRMEYIEVVAGVPDAGAAVATINAKLAPAEIRSAIEDADAKVIFADAASAALVRQSGMTTPIVELGDAYEALLAGAVAPAAYPTVEEWDVWTIPYTSGTTGKPKGVLLSHRSRLLVGLISASEFGCFGPDDKFLAITPMNHGGGLGFPASALSTGGTVEIMDKFDPVETLRRLKFGGVTGIFMVPTHFQLIFALPQELLDAHANPPIRAIIANAAPLPQVMKERIVPYFGATVLNEIYSSTESGLVCNLRPKFQLLKERCVGTPFAHCEVELRRDDGSVCAIDEVGELWSRAPVLFNGYWKRPEETAAAIRDGWVSVGDMARRDAEGFLYIVDRKKDMVISGGVNIYPREIEEVLLGHPAIADVAVIGVPDETWGERLLTFAVVHDGRTITNDELADFCAGKLAGFKIPKELRLTDTLPRNANGKVLKTELRLRA